MSRNRVSDGWGLYLNEKGHFVPFKAFCEEHHADYTEQEFIEWLGQEEKNKDVLEMALSFKRRALLKLWAE